MAAITFKCPNCGGELNFDPSSQKYLCPYCGSSFSQQELDALSPAQGQEYHDDTAAPFPEEGGASGDAVVYSCPSCGAQIVTDETTAATFCFYCHNPVVLEGRVSGDYLPDKIIPFEISQKEATEKFKSFVRRKKYVPRAFWSESQIEKMTGVYYPFWIYDADVDGSFQADGTRLRVWRDSKLEYTETSIYDVRRSGTMEISQITRNALQKTDRELVENVQPFRLNQTREFNMGYLSGFVAEKRDIEKQEFSDALQKEVSGYAKQLLEGTAGGYTPLKVKSSNYRIAEETWTYVLLPVWVLTYRAGANVYYFAMNGQTGTVAGRLPVDYRKLLLHCGIIFAALTMVFLMGGYLL